MALTLLLAGCDVGGVPETSPSAAAQSTIPTAAPTTVASTATKVEERPDSDAGPFPAGEPVDLLVLSDSGGIGVAERYAVLAAEALDRNIRVHDWAKGGTRITEVLGWVQNSLADRVAEAEIIVLYAHPAGLDHDLPEPNILTCFEAADAVIEAEEYTGDWTPGTKWEPTPVVPTVEDWQPYRNVLDQIYDEIWKIRAGQPTILRAYDPYCGFLAPWTELGIDSECMGDWEAQTHVIREAAEDNGAAFVSLFDVFNGPSHDEDPNEKGWMWEDGWHAGEAGLAVVADALAAVGFEPSEPPGKAEPAAATVRV